MHVVLIADKAVKHIDGIESVNVTLLSNSMVVEFDEKKVNDALIMKTEDAAMPELQKKLQSINNF